MKASPLRHALVAGSAVSLALSLTISRGAFDPLALGLVTLATVSALLALWRSVGGRDWWTWLPAAVLSAGLALSLIIAASTMPGIYVDEAQLGPYRPLLGLAAIVIASFWWRSAPRAVAGLRFPALLVLAAVLGGLVIKAAPAPWIDVWVLRSQGPRALLDGLDPYAVGYPNIYGPGTSLISPSLLSADGRYVLAYPYTPLTLLLDVIGHWAGDVRWISLVAVLGSAWLVHRLGRASLEAELAAALLLVQPVALFVLEQAWSEPVVLALVLLTALAVGRQADDPARPAGEEPSGAPGEAVAAVAPALPAWLLPGLAAAAAAGSKQYAPLLLLPLLLALPPRLRVRAAALAAGGAVALAAPFLAWNPEAFIRGVLKFQLLQPFRSDALAWSAALARAGGPELPAWPAFLLAAGVLALAARRRSGVATALLTGACAWLVLVLFNKQAFCNYYWLAVGLLCAAVAAWPGRPGEDRGVPGMKT